MRIGPLNTSGPVGRSSKTASAKSGDSVASAAAPRDAATIMGVPEAELTPNVQRALLSLMGEVDQLRRETEMLRKKVRDLETMADHDVMLPVLNRRAFMREVGKAQALAERHGAPSALVFLDLNGFKAVNDTHGHAAGDAALEHIASILTAHVRETDSVGRLGGDEFGLVLTLTNEASAEKKASELAEIIAGTPIEHDGQTFHLGAAWGAFQLGAGGDPETAMAEADRAMYARKKAQKAESGSDPARKQA